MISLCDNDFSIVAPALDALLSRSKIYRDPIWRALPISTRTWPDLPASIITGKVCREQFRAQKHAAGASIQGRIRVTESAKFNSTE
jgi:hypothetical protein